MSNTPHHEAANTWDSLAESDLEAGLSPETAKQLRKMARNTATALRGRPPIPEEDKRSVQASTMLTTTESEAVDEAAGKLGISRSDWIRQAVGALLPEAKGR